MQKAILKFRDYQGKELLSGISNGQNVTSHANLNGANDFSGRSAADRVDLLAPYDCKVKAIATADNTVLFQSLTQVETPAGINYCWFLCTHMLDKDFQALGIALDKEFKQGEPCYTEGSKNAYGVVMGNHIHMEQGIGRWNGSSNPYYKSNDTYTYQGKTYYTYYPNIEGYECPIADMFFIPAGIEKVEGTSDVAKAYKWVELSDEPDPEPAEPSAAATENVINYKGLPVYIAKISKDNDIMGSVDGNHYGQSYDATIPAGFGDKDLEAQGYKEVAAGNGSTFYYYDGQCYAEGMEISKGVNNQDFTMSVVSKFENCMAVGFPKTGGIIIDYQKNIMAKADQMYGAITGAFGIIKDGKLNIAGSEDNRGNCFTVKSGRHILAEDDGFIYDIAFEGVTGKTGLTGAELYDLVKTVAPAATSAICFDGGGSVFQRINGETRIDTSRKVKNAVLIFAKPKTVEEKPEEGSVDDFEALYNDLKQKHEELIAENKNALESLKTSQEKLEKIKNILEE